MKRSIRNTVVGNLLFVAGIAFFFAGALILGGTVTQALVVAFAAAAVAKADEYRIRRRRHQAVTA